MLREGNVHHAFFKQCPSSFVLAFRDGNAFDLILSRRRVKNGCHGAHVFQHVGATSKNLHPRMGVFLVGDPPCSPLPRGESLFDPADAAAEPKGVCGGNAPGLPPHRQPTAHPPSAADAVLREGVEQVAEVVEG